MSKFVPIIKPHHKPWQVALLVFVALLLIFTWGTVVDKAFGATAPASVTAPVSIPGSPATQPQVVSPKSVPVPEGGYRQHHHVYKNTKRVKASVHLRLHTVSYHVKDKNGNPVARMKKGHIICPKGWYGSFSKYSGMYCENFKEDKKLSKAVIVCGGDVAIGYIFGKVPGAAGVFAGCIWHGLMN